MNIWHSWQKTLKNSSKGKGNERKETSTKKWSNKRSQFGCYKCGKTDHHIKDCPQWEIEWRKERAKKERTAKQKKECAMVAAWGSGTKESDDEEIVETTSIAVGDSDL